MGHTVLPILMAVLSHCMWGNVEVSPNSIIFHFYDKHIVALYLLYKHAFCSKWCCKCSYRYHSCHEYQFVSFLLTRTVILDRFN